MIIAFGGHASLTHTPQNFLHSNARLEFVARDDIVVLLDEAYIALNARRIYIIYKLNIIDSVAFSPSLIMLDNNKRVFWHVTGPSCVHRVVHM